MILTYGGRLPDPTDFPEENVGHVGEQIQRLIRSLAPRLVVGSAAAGADLLVIEAALESGAKARVLIAGSINEFRASSVAGRGGEWEQLFDLLQTDEGVQIITLVREAEDDISYTAVNTRILAEAAGAAEPHEEVIGLNVSAPREKAGHSEQLAGALKLHDQLVLRVDPTRRRETTPTGFVAMPYGRRRDHARGWSNYDCEATYKRIILPALIDAGYRPVRADTESLLEVIDLTMLREINTADVLVADLATLNPNVMWEVGVRHAWRRAGTILLRPSHIDPPFDVSHARVHPYTREETQVSDENAVAGITLLRGLLAAAAERRVDSPVFLTLSDLQEAILQSGGKQGTQAAHHHIEAISLAADLGDAERLPELAREVREDQSLDEDARAPLLQQIGLALVGCGAHDEALRLLGPLAERDIAMEHVRLQQQYAHALIRSPKHEGRLERLELAERRLRALLERQSPTGETFGLLGSAAKARAEEALAAGQDPGGHLDIAIDAYLEGFRRDPGDYYPGIVALALLRLRGQRLAPNDEDLRLAHELAPVVRFAATRMGTPSDRDVWALATVAELSLHESLLEPDGAGTETMRTATRLYERLAAIVSPYHRASVARQLRLLRDGGDPPATISPLLDLFDMKG